MAKEGEVVCVTGGSGCIGSWLVRELLHRGYNVHATVQDLSYKSKCDARSIFHHFIIIIIIFPNILSVVLCCVAEDENETKHLEEGVEGGGAETRLRLFQIDLLDYPSILRAVSGCAGVFHLASPCIIDQVQDPQVCAPIQILLQLQLILYWITFLF